MRKLTVTENITLDGVMESPEDWAPKYQSEDFHAAMFEGMDATSTMLFGRVTFEQFAAFWPDSDMEPFASHMRNATKYVVSTSLESAEWGAGNSVPIIRGDLATEIPRIKQESRSNISVIGSGGLVRSLMNENLVDEYHLCVHPVVIGRGKRLFGDQCTAKLTLVDTRSFSGGIVMLTYLPATSEAS